MDFEQFDDLVAKPIAKIIANPLSSPIPALISGDGGRKRRYLEVTVINPGRGRKVDRTQTIRLQICPFCDQPLFPRENEWFDDLAQTKSSTLPELIVQSWSHSEPDERPTNMCGRRMKSASVELQKKLCNQHRYETMALPVYVQYKWPTKVDFFDLLHRLKRKSVMDRLSLVYYQPESGLLIAGRPAPPKPTTRRGGPQIDESRSFPALEKRIDKRKDRMSTAGYYGERGYGIVSRFIYMVTSILEARTGVSRDEFVNYDAIVTEILLPEAVSVVISEDYECALEDGYHLGWLSDLYGIMEYPQDPNCPVLLALYDESTKEMRAILKELEEDLES